MLLKWGEIASWRILRTHKIGDKIDVSEISRVEYWLQSAHGSKQFLSMVSSTTLRLRRQHIASESAVSI